MIVWYGVGFAVAGMMRGHGTDEVRIAVGRRLAGMDNTSHTTLGDSEDSPLQQSKRSSMLTMHMLLKSSFSVFLMLFIQLLKQHTRK